MRTCRARRSPDDDDDQVSSSTLCPSVFPPSPTHTSFHPWRTSPHLCNIAIPSFAGPSCLDAPAPTDLRAKSTPPFDQRRPTDPIYPSPPLTDGGLASTIPLPEVSGQYLYKQEWPQFRERVVDENMSHDGARHLAPLSPPPTVQVSSSELPEDGGHDVESWRYGDHPQEAVHVGTSEPPEGGHFYDDGDGHRIESWRYGEDLQDGGAGAPLLPPVRDDSGYEEFGPQAGCEDDRKLTGSQGAYTLIEPTSVWVPHSPLTMDEGLSLDMPSLHGVLPSLHRRDPSSNYSDALISPISPSDLETGAHSWVPNPAMDWTYSPSHTLVEVLSPPSSPKPIGLTLELPELDSSLGFPEPPPGGAESESVGNTYNSAPTLLRLRQTSPHERRRLPLQQPSPLSPVEISFGQCDPHWFHGESTDPTFGELSVLNQSTPLAEDHDHFFPFSHSSLLRPPSADIDSEFSDTVMPSEDDSAEFPPPSPRRRPLNDLHDPTLPHGDVCLTPVPRSPHSNLLPLADLDMDESAEVPSSPHSPHPLLPELEGEDASMFADHPDLPMETISPSLLGGAPEPQAGLGLFLHSDPPLARSPSPDEDDFGFLDIQMDPESANVEVDEFLALRALRKNALAQERAARMAEAEFGERITAVASALLPPSHADVSLADPDAMQTDPIVLDATEKRLRKRELHSLMDMRAEAHRTRKLQKQRSKEIGALLDFKMHTPMSPMEGLPPLIGGGKGWTRSIAHLVAHMVLRRRDRSRPLENKPPSPQSPIRRPTGLRRCVSSEDLLSLSPGSEEDEDDDMEM